MDGNRFDRWLTNLAASGTRRGALHLLAFLAGAFTFLSAEGRKSGKRAGGRPGGKRYGRNRPRRRHARHRRHDKNKQKEKPSSNCDIPCDGDPSSCGAALQAAIAAAGAEPIRVCPGRYAGTFVIDADVTLIGSGDGADPANNTILDAQQSGRVVSISGGVTVELEGLRITGGLAAGQGAENSFGGGVYIGDSSLAMTGCTVTGNSATSHGGGIDNSGGTVALDGCSVNQNTTARVGGGIHNHDLGTCTITGSSVTGNTASQGGGVYVSSGTLTLDGSSVTENTATGANGGGGIFNEGSGGATVTLQNGSTVTNNSEPNCVGTINGPGCGP